MKNVVPVQALVVGIVGILVGVTLLPHMRSSFVSAQKDLLSSAERRNKGSRKKHFASMARDASTAMTRVNDVIYTAFRWLSIGIGALAILAYLIGFFGVNLAELLLGRGNH